MIRILALILCAPLYGIGCKSDEAVPVSTPPTVDNVEPASAKPTRPKAQDSEDDPAEIEIDAHCEMISRDPEMPADRVRVDEGQVLVKDPVYFETGTSKIPVSSYGLMNEIAYQICKTPEIRLLEIGVHTDQKGSGAYNQKASQEKADALLEYLADFIEPERLRAKGYGESLPISKGSAPADHALNRRVEFVIIP